MLRDIILKSGENEIDAKIDNRPLCLIRWIIKNEKALMMHKTIKINLNVKGEDVKGDVTLLLDSQM